MDALPTPLPNFANGGNVICNCGQRKEAIKMSEEAKKMSGFVGIGTLIGVIIGGFHHGIMGAMIGAVAGSILISSGIEVQIRDLKVKGKFHPFRGALVVSYVLAIVGTFIGIQVHGLLASESPDFFWNSVMRYVVPAFAGGIGALIPVWVSGAGKGK